MNFKNFLLHYLFFVAAASLWKYWTFIRMAWNILHIPIELTADKCYTS